MPRRIIRWKRFSFHGNLDRPELSRPIGEYEIAYCPNMNTLDVGRVADAQDSFPDRDFSGAEGDFNFPSSPLHAQVALPPQRTICKHRATFQDLSPGVEVGVQCALFWKYKK